MGSTSSYVYIFFSCDDAVITGWSSQLSLFRTLLGVPTYIPPIIIQSAIKSLIIIRPESATVIEGTSFPIQPALQVLGK